MFKILEKIYDDIKKGIIWLKKKVENHIRNKRYDEKMDSERDFLIEEMIKSEYFLFEMVEFTHYLSRFKFPLMRKMPFYVLPRSYTEVLRFLIGNNTIQYFEKYRFGILKQYILCNDCHFIIKFTDKIDRVIGECSNCNNSFRLDYNGIHKIGDSWETIYKLKTSLRY